MAEIIQGSKSSVLEQKVNQYEMAMKDKFVRIMSQPGIKYADALDYIDNELKQSKKMAKINYRIRCFRNDGIYQLNQAISQVFGAVVSKEQRNPSGESSVQTVDITLADGTRVKAPYGDISLEGLGEGSSININYDSSTHDLVITGKCQFRFSSLMDDIIEVTKHNLRTNSIYKGQALEISDINDPKILDLSGIDRQLMVLSKETEYALRPIYARIMNPTMCLEKGIPLKFGALLEGGYGTGKTLLAFKLAKIIDQSGHGVLIFVEDIDQVTRGNRDSAMQDILNTLDGGDTKDMNVITLFTTNHIELIEPTFLRGKRVGTIISLGPLDAETAEQFIRKSFEIGCYTILDDLTDVCKFIEASHIAPAFMAEIIEKVKSMMVLANQCEVKADDIKYSVQSYLRQVELSRTKDMSVTPEKKFVDSLLDILHLPKNEETMRRFIKMMEEHCDGSIDDYKD